MYGAHCQSRFRCHEEVTVFELKPIVWIVCGVILAALEILIPGLVIIWFGIAAVVTGIVAFFIPNQYVQFGIFVFLSAALVLLAQRIARRITKPEPEPVGANRMLGAVGIVSQEIRPPEVGRIKVAGEEWRAEAKAALGVGTRVRVLRVDGTRVLVEPFEERSE
ncbi:MAG: NfeD family protein [candidate division WOR-3 bacterium]